MLGNAMSSGRVRTRRAALGLALTVAAATALTGCSALGSDSSNASSNGGGLEKSKIKVSIMPTTDLGPFWLAMDGGYFKSEGLEVEQVVAKSGQESMQKAIAGEVDIALSTYTPFFIAKSKDTDIQLVADGTSVNAKSNAIVTVPNSPVKTVNDLKGRRIAITAKNTASDILTKSVMKDHGVDFTGVQWTLVTLPNMAAALKNNEVDAAYMPEPMLTQAAKTVGATPVIDINTGASQDFPLTGYGSMTKWVQGNPKTLAAFQRAMKKATSDAINDRSKVEPLLVKYAKIDEDTAKLLTLPGYGSVLDARRLQRVPDLLLQMGVITSKVDAAPMIAPQATS
ncbi:sulfonate/nitrate/taurine ABC transporter periplasmic protein [Amycolatopsis mediterranei S699]|uniref:Periplasmic substrate-binding component of ABC-type sulfonate/nitrate/taurine transport system n=2 Tax=Amycolatopsis mediterranei TaxID=33910 RepID=A0A0H3DJ91_AMYMU|nr:periplasmic substrate-binding component of ABC-type sulfonate/nitrate/taurine transport system [Amycolatopsis mediterranei U32]AFO81936.1 sulfonate/nitrate/taurine ABC transporter periplasmic protein [Amycolatopsis mediterranei S699]AGT89065.1 sulfonate/nitrate/taurine ABC transporter periplasmic protein [Amycolatopsis mediterranei RB]KDO07523.1 sulfonate ABC transporter substrate-binding protein [Amycolatopsis mediterranei]KDU93582.1 sulfonate ABC transporter substrate-binding protein [Amyc